MAIILNIDTAEDFASVSLARAGIIIDSAVNENAKDHAAWLHNAIHHLLKNPGFAIKDINAVAVSIGPGSYTGLRVGLSSAKGLCYALDVPLIAVSTLKLIAHTASGEPGDLICPMIDARRMEVFTAIYDKNLIEIKSPCAMVLNEGSFSTFLSANKIIFCGSGINKLEKMLIHDNASFVTATTNVKSMSYLSYQSYIGKTFADVAYSEPLYIKEFYSPPRKPFI